MLQASRDFRPWMVDRVVCDLEQPAPERKIPSEDDEPIDSRQSAGDNGRVQERANGLGQRAGDDEAPSSVSRGQRACERAEGDEPDEILRVGHLPQTDESDETGATRKNQGNEALAVVPRGADAPVRPDVSGGA